MALVGVRMQRLSPVESDASKEQRTLKRWLLGNVAIYHPFPLDLENFAPPTAQNVRNGVKGKSTLFNVEHTIINKPASNPVI